MDRDVALNIIVSPERLGWTIKRHDRMRVVAWFRSKDDALRVGRAIAETERLRLVVQDHGGIPRTASAFSESSPPTA